MTGARHPTSKLLVLAGAAVFCLVLPLLPTGLVLPPVRKGLFAITTIIAVLATLAFVLRFHWESPTIQPKRPFLSLVVAPAGSTVVCVLLYLSIESHVIIPYDNRGDEDQNPAVLMPLWLPEDLQGHVDREGGRAALVRVHTPLQIEDELANNPLSLHLTAFLLAIIYGAIFGCLMMTLSGVVLITGNAVSAGNATPNHPENPAEELGDRRRPTTPASQPRRYDTFICHASEDKALALKVCAGLEREGLKCWIAPRDVPSGTKWADRIMEGIHGSHTMVLVFTASANASDHVEREVAEAADRQIPILKLRFDTVPASKALHYFTRSLQWVDASSPPRAGEMKQLAQRIRELAHPVSV